MSYSLFHKRITFFIGAIFITLLLLCSSFAEIDRNGSLVSDYIRKAYSFYLLDNFDSSIVYYNDVLSIDSSHSLAWIGLVDSYIAQKKYKRAALVGSHGLKINPNYNLSSRVAVSYELHSNSNCADSFFELSASYAEKENLPENIYSDFIMKLGKSAFLVGNYRRASYWFAYGDSLFRSEEFHDALIHTQEIFKQKRQNVSFISGFIRYNNDEFISHGIYNSLLTDFMINTYGMKVGYANLLLKYRSDQSSIEASDSKKKGKEKDSIQETDQGDIGTDLIQHDIFFVYHSKLPKWKTDLESGFRISLSDIIYSKYANSFFIGHSTKFNNMSAGVTWYYTSVPENSLLQMTSHFAIDLHLINTDYRFSIMPQVVRGNLKKNSDPFVPDRQFSIDLEFKALKKHIAITLTGMAGKRAFSNEPHGLVFLNVVEDFRYGTKALIEISPFPIPVTVYYLFRFNSYDYHSTISHLGGLFFQW